MPADALRYHLVLSAWHEHTLPPRGYWSSRTQRLLYLANKLRDPNPSGAKMLARVLVVIGVSRLG
jgi:hypothetical protein